MHRVLIAFFHVLCVSYRHRSVVIATESNIITVVFRPNHFLGFCRQNNLIAIKKKKL